jgi:hypothetical protein
MAENSTESSTPVQDVVMRLSATQAELFQAMRNGVVCHYMPYMGRFCPNAYYFRSDTKKRCTAPARALKEKGLVVSVDKDSWGGHKLIFKSDA